MTPYFQNEWAKIYHGDNRKILTHFQDNAAFATVTDPSYDKAIRPDTVNWVMPWPYRSPNGLGNAS